MSNNKTMLYGLKVPNKLDFAYLLLSAIFTRMFINPQFMDLDNNFERNILVLISVTTIIAFFLITTAPHKIINNFFFRLILRNRKLHEIDLKKLKIRISSTYSSLAPSLRDFWGSIIIFFAIILFWISIVLQNPNLPRIPILIELFSKIIKSGSGQNDFILDNGPETITVLFYLLLLLIIMQFYVVYSKIREYKLRLYLGLIFGYFNTYEYNKILDNAVNGINELKDEQKTYFELYEKHLGFNWTKIENLVKERKTKIKGELLKLKSPLKSLSNLSLITNSLEIYGLCIFMPYRKINVAKEFMQELKKLNDFEKCQVYLEEDGKPTYDWLINFF